MLIDRPTYDNWNLSSRWKWSAKADLYWHCPGQNTISADDESSRYRQWRVCVCVWCSSVFSALIADLENRSQSNTIAELTFKKRNTQACDTRDKVAFSRLHSRHDFMVGMCSRNWRLPEKWQSRPEENRRPVKMLMISLFRDVTRRGKETPAYCCYYLCRYKYSNAYFFFFVRYCYFVT